MSTAIPLLATRATVNGAPSGASAGISTSDIRSALRGGNGPIAALVRSTAGSASMSVTVRLWGYFSSTWSPLGVGADSTKGVMNAGSAIGEVSADVIAHAEMLDNWHTADRLYAEITAISGTGTSVAVDLMAGTETP